MVSESLSLGMKQTVFMTLFSLGIKSTDPRSEKLTQNQLA